MASRNLRSVGSTEDAFINAVAAMPPEFLACRGSSHRFNISDDFRVVDSVHEQGKRPQGGQQVYAERRLECDRCGMVRVDHYAITSRGGHTMLTKINAIYSAPEGYATVGLGRIAGNRGLVLGMALDNQLQGRNRGRGRPRRDQA